MGDHKVSMFFDNSISASNREPSGKDETASGNVLNSRFENIGPNRTASLLLEARAIRSNQSDNDLGSYPLRIGN